MATQHKWIIPCIILTFSACASHIQHASMGTKDFKNLPKVASLDTKTQQDVPPTTSQIVAKSLPLTLDGITLTEATLCKSIENLVPSTPEIQFSNDVGRIYLLTKVSVEDLEAEGNNIRHIWYFKDRPVASVRLTVKGANYRTYSSKLIPPAYRGSWRVDVVTASNRVLESYPFFID